MRASAFWVSLTFATGALAIAAFATPSRQTSVTLRRVFKAGETARYRLVVSTNISVDPKFPLPIQSAAPQKVVMDIQEIVKGVDPDRASAMIAIHGAGSRTFGGVPDADRAKLPPTLAPPVLAKIDSQNRVISTTPIKSAPNSGKRRSNNPLSMPGCTLEPYLSGQYDWFGPGLGYALFLPQRPVAIGESWDLPSQEDSTPLQDRVTATLIGESKVDGVATWKVAVKGQVVATTDSGENVAVFPNGRTVSQRVVDLESTTYLGVVDLTKGAIVRLRLSKTIDLRRTVQTGSVKSKQHLTYFTTIGLTRVG